MLRLNSISPLITSMAEALRRTCLRRCAGFGAPPEQGHAEAQNAIGYACDTGATGETNVVEAYMWYQLAVRQGEARSQVNLKRLMPRLTAEQISEGKHRLQKFTPRPAALPNALPMEPAASADSTSALAEGRPQLSGQASQKPSFAS
jgi:TPR repeat protein